MRISDWSSDVCSSDLVVRAQRECPAITVVIDRSVEDPLGRVDVVVEVAGRAVLGHAAVAHGGAGEFPVVLLVRIGPDELGTGHLVGEQSLRLAARDPVRSEEHTSELQSLMRISYAVFCLKT